MLMGDGSLPQEESLFEKNAVYAKALMHKKIVFTQQKLHHLGAQFF